MKRYAGLVKGGRSRRPLNCVNYGRGRGGAAGIEQLMPYGVQGTGGVLKKVVGLEKPGTACSQYIGS